MTVIDSIEVWTSDTGAPTRFVYRGRRWLVTGRPQRWMARQAWWDTQTRVPRGTAATAIEQPVWQVDAAAIDDGETVQLQLAVDRERRRWHILPD